MTKLELKQTTLMVNSACENCHDMLVKGLMQLKELERRGITKVDGFKSEIAKVDPKALHNYDPIDAYKPTKLESSFVHKPNKHKILY